jgi:hypothetical protein
MNYLKKFLKRKLPWVFSTIKWAYFFITGRTFLGLQEKKLSKIRDTKGQFNLKIQYKMAHDRNPMLSIYADKSRVREFVTEKIGDKYLSKIYVDTQEPELIDFSTLPLEYVIKANHGSGAVIIVWNGAPIEYRLNVNSGKWSVVSINPKSFEDEKALQIMKKWISQNYYWVPGQLPEWAYKNIEPRVIIEELFTDNQGGIPNDFKFYMIDGKCEFIHVRTDEHGLKTRDLFDSSWSKLPINMSIPNSRKEIMKPTHLEEMLMIAQELSKGIDFIRVDLYETNGGVKFGELTNYPDGGTKKFKPKIYNTRIGETWTPKY